MSLQPALSYKARKRHRCSDCLDDIKVGETYMRADGREDGRRYVWRSHLGCYHLEDTTYAKDLMASQDGLREGWLWDGEFHEYTEMDEALRVLRAANLDEEHINETLRRSGLISDDAADA